MAMSPPGFKPKKDCVDEATAITENYRTDFSSERAPHFKRPIIV
jgi:hypothetical protein